MFTAEMARKNTEKISAKVEAIINVAERAVERRSKEGKYDATIVFAQMTLSNEECGKIRNELTIVRGYFCSITNVLGTGFVIKLDWKHARFGERRQ